MLHNPTYVRLVFPNLVEQPFIHLRIIQNMNQQTSYSIGASVLECKKNNLILNSKEPVLPTKEFQTMPNVVELTRIMIGTIAGENARNMTQRERQAFYNITNKFLSLTDELN